MQQINVCFIGHRNLCSYVEVYSYWISCVLIILKHSIIYYLQLWLTTILVWLTTVLIWLTTVPFWLTTIMVKYLLARLNWIETPAKIIMLGLGQRLKCVEKNEN